MLALSRDSYAGIRTPILPKKEILKKQQSLKLGEEEMRKRVRLKDGNLISADRKQKENHSMRSADPSISGRDP